MRLGVKLDKKEKKKKKKKKKEETVTYLALKRVFIGTVKIPFVLFY